MAIMRFTHYLHIWLRIEHHFQPGAQDGVIIS
jgi:hypothetical protein